MDEFRPNDMQYSNSTDYMADDHSFAGISDADEGLHDPMRHLQQEDQAEEDYDPTETIISALTGQFMMKTNQQTLPTLLSKRDDPSPDAPSTSGMINGATDMQSPNQLPENSALERLTVKVELILQELEQEIIQRAKPSALRQRSQLPSTMLNQNSSQNQVHSQINHATNCFMPPDTSTAISPDERPVTARVVRFETTRAKSSLNTSDSFFRPWETKAPTAETNLQALGKHVQQNL